MNQPSKIGRGETSPRQRATSLDLILQARALRYRCLASAFARLAGLAAARLGRARPSGTPQPAAPENMQWSGRGAI
jgi:hypothetical protein